MKFSSFPLFRQLIERKKLEENKIEFKDQKQEILIKQGREQFKKLIEKGLSIPVVLL